MTVVGTKLQASRAALKSGTLFDKWMRANPGEYARCESYWAKGDFFPTVATATGNAYALMADAYHYDTAEMPFAPI